jgi:hypothetical protein
MLIIGRWATVSLFYWERRVKYILMALALIVTPAIAQSIDDHATGHDIYKDWKRPGGGMSCCSGKDCGPWSIEDVSPAQNGFWIHSLEKFVPMKHVLPSPDGQYHVCCRRSAPDLPCEKNEDGNTTVFCLAVPMVF